MVAGSTCKRCSCRDSVTGKQLGRKCSRLYRNGGWNHAHGRWHFQFELPDGPQGQRRTVRRGPFDSQTDAEHALDQVRDLLAIPESDDPHGIEQVATIIQIAVRTKKPLPSVQEVHRLVMTGVPVDEIPTVEERLIQWLAGRRTIRKNTYRSYESHIRLYLVPHLGRIRIDRLRADHVEAMFTAIEEFNTLIRLAKDSDDPELRAKVKGRRVVGDASMQRIRATLRKALNDSIPRYISTNPACHVELASGKRPKPLIWTAERVARWQQTGVVPGAVMVWTPQQTGQFLDHIAGHRLYALFHLVAYRGLRRGEACAVHDDDISADFHELMIRMQLVQVGWEVVEGQPKTDAGERPVALDAETLRVLQAHQVVRDAERAVCGDSWVDQTGLLFTHPDGTPLHPAMVTDLFTALTAAAGLPPIRLHDLRHGAATMALAAGVDMKVVQDMLGHSCQAVTADTYTSVLQELAKAGAEAIAAIIPRNRAA